MDNNLVNISLLVIVYFAGVVFGWFINGSIKK